VYRRGVARFEEGDKFWEIVVEGTTVRTRSGRVGTDGRLLAPKSSPTLEKATKD